MSSDERVQQTLLFCLTLIIMVAVITGLKYCSHQDDLRATCVERGQSAVDCRVLFDGKRE